MKMPQPNSLYNYDALTKTFLKVNYLKKQTRLINLPAKLTKRRKETTQTKSISDEKGPWDEANLVVVNDVSGVLLD
jgi:hypothetical protein